MKTYQVFSNVYIGEGKYERMIVMVEADWYEVGRKGRLSFFRDYSDGSSIQGIETLVATFNTWDYVQEVQAN